MISCLKLKKEQAQAALKFLRQKEWIDSSRILGKTTRYMILPLKKGAKTRELLKKFPGSTIEARSFEKREDRKVKTLREALKGVIPAAAIEKVNRSYDVVGDIAVINLPEGVSRLEKSIAWTLKRTQPNVNIVVKKSDKVAGRYRVPKIDVLVGPKRTKTVHRESGVEMNADVATSYFSARLGHERLRISKQVKEEENILVMFCGVGPYPLVIARHNPSARLWAIEVNPAAFKLMKENIKLNHLEKKIKAYKGDVRKVTPRLRKKFDRIVMMLPKSAEKFLDVALAASHRGTVIHVYQFASDKEIPQGVKERVLKEVAKTKKKVKIKRVAKCGSFAPRVWRVCVDLVVL